ncbi:hypothetical protein COLO4_12145 [Corchorus olitorius]|uniref:Cytosine-specific methyltransferase n=1 Tax=Corchorus olitorius TaxID=93759 RepID=A0A1R3K202_9ROSI|nr:hypothetical protein COLO4_12145 [Corchorus olitorius]
MKKNKKGKQRSDISPTKKVMETDKRSRKRNVPPENSGPAGSLRRPKRAAACTDFKEKSVRVSEKSSVIETKRDILADDEIMAVGLTSGAEEDRPNRRLNDFILHDSEGSARPIEMLEGEFIYHQLIGLDETSKKNDQCFAGLPVLSALRDESGKRENVGQEIAFSGGTLRIGKETGEGESKVDQSYSSTFATEEDEDAKAARLLQEQEIFESMKQKKNQGPASMSNKFYIKINEDEIANDYPFPAYYKNSNEETDELVVFDRDFDVCDPEDLPKSMLHNWSFYNSDSRLISLELLPMKPCPDIDVTIFGSGQMTNDDGSGFCLDDDPNQSASGCSTATNADGMPIFLSAIKEWTIEFGASMIFVLIRTDMAWYRLGKPSKQYLPWYEPVLKTARLAISIIALLKEQSRVSRLSFNDVIKRVSEFKKDNRAFISSDPAAVERYIVVHGQIILQLFAGFPDVQIQKCAFVVGLTKKMEERHHTKWLVKKKKVVQKSEPNLNPRAAMVPVASKRNVMQATTTKLINRIWGEYYSNYLPEDLNEETGGVKEGNEEDDNEEQEENEDDAEEDKSIIQETQKSHSVSRRSRQSSTVEEIRWDGEPVNKTSSDEPLYKRAIIRGEVIIVGSSVLIEVDSCELPSIYFVEYMFETSGGSKMFHGRMMQRGSETVLGNAANEREVFLTNDCGDFELQDVKQTVVVDIRLMPWGYQHRKENANMDRSDRAKAEERRKKGLPMEYYCKSLYCPERGAFFRLPFDALGLGSGFCHSCKEKEATENKEIFEVNSSKTGFVFSGIEYSVYDYVYVSPYHFSQGRAENECFKAGRNIGLKPYVVCQVLEIIVPKEQKKARMESTQIKLRRFFRPEDISAEKAYSSDIREVVVACQRGCIKLEATDLAASLNEEEINNLPLPGQVDFINGGPPCQGFSGMNRFNQSLWSKVQCEMILAFLSFADYFRPRYFLLENVRNFVSFNKGQTFRLTLASLLEMGYQVRFGILEAGAYGVSQSRKRAFIWAASPEETLPEWPEPMHVFASPQLKITLSHNLQYAAARSTASGAPFRAITVRDTIGDLPAVGNGASKTNLEYESEPISWFQKKIRGNMAVLTDHISKEMNELNLIRCQKIPKRPGADWQDLPDEKDRILTVRECARSQGFPDSYKFSGNIQHKHRQIGNAVPPTLAFALGRKLKEAVDSKKSM